MTDDATWTAPEPLEPGEVLPGVRAERFTVEEESLRRCGRKAGMTEYATNSVIEKRAAGLAESSHVYQVVKFVNPRDAVTAIDGLAVHAVSGPHDADAHGIIVAHPQRDGCMVSFHDVLTNEETTRTDVRNFVEIIVL